MAAQCSPSTACQMRKSRHRGRARASSGISQITNCGEYTLLVRIKAATIRNASWASLGLRGAARARTAISTQATRKRLRAEALMASASSGFQPRRPATRL